MIGKLPIRTIIYHTPDPRSGLPTRITFIRQIETLFTVKTFRVYGDSSLRRVAALRASYQVLTRWPYHAEEIPNLRLLEQVRHQTREAARRQLERIQEPVR